VSHLLIRLGFVLRPLSRTRFFITTANPACSCVYICKFQFRPIHPPPSRRLSRASSQGRTTDQVPVEQVREAERSTMSLSSKSMRRSGRPGPDRASPRGRATDQVLTEQIREAERPAKSLPSKTARWSDRSGPCRASLRSGPTNQISIEQVRETDRLIRSLSSKSAMRSDRSGPRNKQVCEAERPTRSLPSKSTRQSDRLGPSRASPRGRAANRVPTEEDREA
jgi:hypothetical protein